MKRHPFPRLCLVGLSVALACACSGPPQAPSPAEQEPAQAADQALDQDAVPGQRSSPLDARARAEPVPAQPSLPVHDSQQVSAEKKRGTFAPAPREGWVIRTTCHMGGCVWNRYDDVQRAGSAEAPHYRLRVTQGDSKHPEAYPDAPDGVAIVWDASAQSADVRCSRTAPYAAVEGHGESLKLNPRGVFGAVQGLANLYFASCHGEYGDDAQLAAKYGYDLR